jgi:hypothetical protein
MKLVIDRSKWLRGEDGKDTSLLRLEDGKMCCLGFYCHALGFRAAELRDVPDPEDLNHYRPVPDWLIADDGSNNSQDCCDLINVNDESSFNDFMREAFIKETFAKHGVEVEFVDAS